MNQCRLVFTGSKPENDVVEKIRVGPGERYTMSEMVKSSECAVYVVLENLKKGNEWRTAYSCLSRIFP